MAQSPTALRCRPVVEPAFPAATVRPTIIKSSGLRNSAVQVLMMALGNRGMGDKSPALVLVRVVDRRS